MTSTIVDVEGEQLQRIGDLLEALLRYQLSLQLRPEKVFTDVGGNEVQCQLCNTIIPSINYRSRDHLEEHVERTLQSLTKPRVTMG